MLKPQGLRSEERLLDELSSVISAAADAVLAARRHPLNTHTKPDQSPVTAADHASEALILQGLSRLLPGVPVLSEEAEAKSMPSQAPTSSFVLVDPLDGTASCPPGGANSPSTCQSSTAVLLGSASSPHRLWAYCGAASWVEVPSGRCTCACCDRAYAYLHARVQLRCLRGFPSPTN